MKKMILMVIGLASFAAHAQREVVVIDRSKNTRTRQERMPLRMVEHRHVFKMDPIRMSIGEINFSYERKIDEKLSLEFELGPTVSNLGFSRFEDVFQDPNSLQYTKTSRMSAFGSVALRYYPLDDRLVFNQLYISPKFKFRRYTEGIEALAPSTLGIKNGFTNESIFTFNVGYQQWLAQNFSFDYYLGFGIAGYRNVTYSPVSQYDGNTNEWIETWVEQDRNRARFLLTAGIKVGIGN